MENLFQRNFSMMEMLREDEIQRRLKRRPYYDAIKIMQTIREKHCPFDKLLVLVEVRKSIDRNVKMFWEGI